MFPFVIHVIPVPRDAQLGPRLLPMFYAPLLAALLGRSRSVMTLALAAPWLNWALTSHPAPLGAAVMMVELLAFVLVFRLLMTGIGAPGIAILVLINWLVLRYHPPGPEGGGPVSA